MKRPFQYDILTVSNYKTLKGEGKGYKTALINLAPYNTAGITDKNGKIINLCPKAKTCQEICLHTAGRNIYSNAFKARQRRTALYIHDRKAFIERAKEEIHVFVRRTINAGLIPVIRPNGLSDQPKLAHDLAAEFPSVQFYDYTKLPKPYQRVKANYSLVFSFDGTNTREAVDTLHNGLNVAVVFDTKKNQELPLWFLNYPVIDGDETDLRFLDDTPRIVGLRAKGKARYTSSAFVVRPEEHEKYALSAAFFDSELELENKIYA